MPAVLCPNEWADQQFAQAELGDPRRTQRAVKLAAVLAAAPSASIPEACGRWSDTKAAYRLFKSMQVTLHSIANPHWQQVRSQMANGRIILNLHDTTVLCFNHPATVDLGPTTTKRGHGLGMLLHNSLALDVSGGIDAVPQVLGMAYQQIWSRPQEKPAKAVSESVKWAKAVEATGSPPVGAMWVDVGDAEADCWEMIQASQDHSRRFVLRSSQDRLAMAGHGPAEPSPSSSLYALGRNQQPWGGKMLWVRGRGNQEPRWAKLLVSAMPVTLFSPKNWASKPHRQGKPRPGPIRCWAVRVWEVQAPADVEPIEWILLTNEPVEDLEAVLRVAWWYSGRWLVEEYHKCLKSGCRVEERQLEYADRLEPLVGMLSVIAVRLLSLKHQAKLVPDRPAAEVVPKQYVTTLAAHRKQSEQMSCHHFWREVAKLGGFLGRKGDGDPGWLTLWRGWHRLQLLVEGYELARRNKKNVGND